MLQFRMVKGGFLGIQGNVGKGEKGMGPDTNAEATGPMATRSGTVRQMPPPPKPHKRGTSNVDLANTKHARVRDSEEEEEEEQEGGDREDRRNRGDKGQRGKGKKQGKAGQGRYVLVPAIALLFG